MSKTKTVTITGYIAFDTYRARHANCFPAGPYTFLTWKPGPDDEQIAICEHTVTVEVPADFDPRPGQVAALKKKKREAEAAFTKLVTEINRQINELTAIECSAGASE